MGGAGACCSICASRSVSFTPCATRFASPSTRAADEESPVAWSTSESISPVAT